MDETSSMGNFHRNKMGLLDDIQNRKHIQSKPVDLSDLNSAIGQSEQAMERMADMDRLKKRVEEALRKPDEKPPELRGTAPLEYLMNVRQNKQDMEDGTWKILITIDLLTIDELVKPSDFANNVAYENHKAHILRSTSRDDHPGFRVTIKVGLLSVGKRVILQCKSKEDAMHSKEFITTLAKLLEIVKKRAD